MRGVIFFFLFLGLCSLSYAETHHMKLLAVSEIDGKLNGSIADLYLDIIPGRGGVFLETFPLTRVDTQISTRFAKNIACELSNKDCNAYNFIYTIKAETAIIGGPSAGAALAILTAAALLDLPIREDRAITGTINSGGLIGPVSGIPEKIDSAAKEGIKQVLIPKGTRKYKQFIPTPLLINETLKNQTVNITVTKVMNKSIDLIEYGARYNLSVVEIADLNTAFYEFTGVYLYTNNKNITEEKAYLSVMEDVAAQLCTRTRSLKKIIPPVINTTYTQLAHDLTERAVAAQQRKDYYSQASFCFGANTKLQAQNMLLQNLSEKNINETLSKVVADSNALAAKVEHLPLDTLTDIQAYMIVHERLGETILAKELAEKIIREKTKGSLEQVAYTVERLHSAESWTNFFGTPGKKLTVSTSTVHDACMAKLAEAHERYQYVKTVYPTVLDATEQTLQAAERHADKGQYLLCLHKASKAKAEADLILNTIGVSDDFLADHVKNKLQLVKEAIARAQEKGLFPILGYSYWEYASSLQQYDLYSSLLFSEYAQEMTHLNLYFEEKKDEKKFIIPHLLVYKKEVLIFVAGLLWGFTSALLLFKLRRRLKKR